MIIAPVTPNSRTNAAFVPPVYDTAAAAVPASALAAPPIASLDRPLPTPAELPALFGTALGMLDMVRINLTIPQDNLLRIAEGLLDRALDPIFARINAIPTVPDSSRALMTQVLERTAVTHRAVLAMFELPYDQRREICREARADAVAMIELLTTARDAALAPV